MVVRYQPQTPRARRAVTLVPITLREARRFVGEHHRHNLPPVGWKFGVGVHDGHQLRGVGIAGQPVARLFNDGFTLEIQRVCTDGAPNACSMLYGALVRAGKALGYRRFVTYTLASEPGTSLRAAGFTVAEEITSGPTWRRTGRPRDDVDLFGNERRPTEDKLRWERAA